MTSPSIFVSESVTRGHPDKLCDQVSDAIVDRYLHGHPLGRINVECAMSAGLVFIAALSDHGEAVDLTATAREVIAAAGYVDGEFNAADCSVMTSLKEQRWPRSGLGGGRLPQDLPARDQGTVFGYACSQTEELMPLPVMLAHDMARRLDALQGGGEIAGLLPDAKVQVAVEYRGGCPKRVYSVSVVNTGPATARRNGALREALLDKVVEPSLAARGLKLDDRTRLFFNPDGPIETGGPALHAGLTGRKGSIDTYGEYARHSGAALSGKDLFRLDRMAAYAARHAAKNVIAAGLAEECELQLSYTIGVPEPVYVALETRGTARVAPEEILSRVEAYFDFRTAAILERFGYASPEQGNGIGVFRSLAVYGHMGRTDLGVPWERTDEAEALKT